MIISEKEMISQEMNKTIDSTQAKKDQLVVEINQLDEEINKKQDRLDKVNISEGGLTINLKNYVYLIMLPCIIAQKMERR